MLVARSILAALIAIPVIGDAEAKSKWNPRTQQQPVQTPSNQSAQPSAQDQRGTDQIPFSVKIVPGERTKEQAEKEEGERREKDEKAVVDRQLIDQTQRLADETGNLATYTFWLARFTLFLFFAAVVQIGVFVWQLRLIRKTADAAKEAADIAKTSSEAAIAFERPYVRINGISARIRDINRTFGDVFQNTEIFREPYAICTIENYGKTLAFVYGIAAQLRFSDHDPPCILTVGAPIPVITLKTGGFYSFTVPLGEPINQQRAEDIQSSVQHFWLHFNFVYGDVLGKTHQTTDRWRYDLPLDSFSCITEAYREAT